MNQVIQGDDSGALSVLPAKRGRGRPRKETNLKQVKTEREPPGFEGAKGKRPHKVDSMDGNDNMVGQAVTGVVEATFGAGYVLNVRIGNSNTTLRGVVLKPGHYIPVTDENDIAPHVQMIRGNDIQFSAQNRTLQPGGTAGANLKYASPKVVSSVPPVGVRGTVVPDVLLPVIPSSGQPSSSQMPSDASRAASVLLPGQSIPAGQIPIVMQPQFGHQVAQDSVQNENASSKDGTPEVEKGERGMQSKELQMAGSSRSSEIQNKNGEDAEKI